MPDSLPMPGATSGPPPTLLPADGPDSHVAVMLRQKVEPEDAATRYPSSCLAWAVLADEAFAAGRNVEAYAYARTGYHRGLEPLRRPGWPGTGAGPSRRAPNRLLL